MTYKEMTHIIENSRRFENLPGVEIAKVMLEALGSPQEGMDLIHIAGTNGKGSVSAFLCSILTRAGIKCGMFTSPHLVDFSERISVAGQNIPEYDAVRIGERLIDTDFGVQPTMFDYCLAMALIYFKEQACDVVILETGLGGRLDSTNAVGIPDVTVITQIGFDHMGVLGETLEGIAREKAGIIKSGTSLVLSENITPVQRIFLERAHDERILDINVVDSMDLHDMSFDGKYEHFSYKEIKDITMQMLGTHQFMNAATAIEASLAYAGRSGCGITVQDIYDGIRDMRWPGRMQIISETPFVMIDGAHNESGVEALCDSLSFLYPGEKFRFIMGVMADKDYGDMIDIMSEYATDFVTVTVNYPRAMKAEALSDFILKKGLKSRPGSVDDVFAHDFDGKTIAVGSLYFIGEILEKMKFSEN